MISKTQSDPSIGYGIFFLPYMVLENTQFEVSRQIFEHKHFVQNCPPVPEYIHKFNPFSIGLLDLFLQKRLGRFLRIFPPDF